MYKGISAQHSIPWLETAAVIYNDTVHAGNHLKQLQYNVYNIYTNVLTSASATNYIAALWS